MDNRLLSLDIDVAFYCLTHPTLNDYTNGSVPIGIGDVRAGRAEQGH